MRKKKTPLSIKDVLHIGKIYNAANGTFKQYGEMVTIIEGTKANTCVCCGEIIPEGIWVCQNCESKAKGGCKQ